ncbi:alpha/beta hydrolase [Frateuria defendens]|uniref:alpha/beta hydrolase n=1 Tax=Frateuria defendens TaxID=2219559 RepID=UPI000A756F63|nr:alpha/beta hydrolase [Frateuria defendens]
MSIKSLLAASILSVAAATTANAKAQVEPSTQAFLDQLAAQGGKPIYRLSYADARQVLEGAQKNPASLLPADVQDLTIPGGAAGQVSIRVVRPQGVKEPLPAVVYFHGGGWVLGSKNTHDRLIREIANGARAAVVFVNYTPAPEAQYPVQINQGYAALRWVAGHGAEIGVAPGRIALAGDSVGGNMVAAVSLLAKQQGGPALKGQLLFYPVTDANLDDGSYRSFANGPWLTRNAMAWFWDAYLPDKAKRNEPTASPLRAGIDQLKGLPEALVITDENDVLRDEGEAYAHKLEQAGVRVTATRYLGTIHDFVMLNAISDTPATRAAIDQANAFLRNKLK